MVGLSGALPRAATPRGTNQQGDDANDDEGNDHPFLCASHAAKHRFDRVTRQVSEPANKHRPQCSAHCVGRQKFVAGHRSSADHHRARYAQAVHEAQRDDRSPAPAPDEPIDARHRSGHPWKPLGDMRPEASPHQKEKTVTDECTERGGGHHPMQRQQSRMRERAGQQQHRLAFEKGTHPDGEQPVLLYQCRGIHAT